MQRQQKTKSRGNGEGSIFKSGSRWRAVLTIGQKPDGKPIRKTRTARTRGDAAAALEELKRENGFRVSAPVRGLRLRDWLTEWLDGVKTARSQATHDLYKIAADTHISPHLGQLRLEDIAPVNIKRWLTALQDVGPRARQNAFNVLKRAMNEAVRLQQVRANPLASFQAPVHNRKPILPFTAAQASSIIEWFDSTYWSLFVRTAFETGMRQGEILGLQWGDLDGDLIHVRRQMTERSGLTDPKTAAGKRSVPINGDLVDRFSLARRDALRAARAKRDDLIFQGPRGGQLKRSNFRARPWKDCLAKLSLEYRGPHHMRHTFATLMLNSGVPVTVVSKILGHSKVSVTLDVYSHVLSDDIEKAREALRRIFA